MAISALRVQLEIATIEGTPIQQRLTNYYNRVGISFSKYVHYEIFLVGNHHFSW